MENTTGYIYKITNPSGRVYIGSTSNIQQRFSSYKRLNCKTQTKLYNSFKKYGFDSHTIEVIEETTLDNMLQREGYWGEYFDVLSRDNLNLQLPKFGDTYKGVSDETREKMSDSHKGKKISAESIKKLRESLIGRTLSEETRKKISKSLTGRTHSEESKKRMRENSARNKSKTVLDTVTGIYYDSAKEASESTIYGSSYLAQMLRGRYKNKTNLIYV